MAVNKNDSVLCKVTGLTSEGYGVARVDGFAVFIPSALPGETVRAHIIKVYKSYAIGKLTEIAEAAECRIMTDCAVSERCGGCALRHTDYASELEFKRQRVEQAMRKIAGSDIAVPEVVPSENTLYYRNKEQLPVGRGEDGGIVTGFYAKNSHRIVDNTGCLLSKQIFGEIAAFICDFAKNDGISVYNEDTNRGLLRHLLFRIGESTGEVLVCIVINGDGLPDEKTLISEITAEFPCVKSVYINVNKKATNVVLGDKYICVYGEKCITDILCGNRFFISPQSFYQVNKPQAEKLYTAVLDMLSPTKSDRVLDLYCGIGTITLTAASRCKSVVGVEIVPEAVENAKATASANNVDNVEFICADAGAPLDALTDGMYDAIILDPPRKGISERLAHELCRLSFPKILYISCGPETLARDIKLFTEGGYSIKSIKPFDLFPRTAHVETVVLMSKVR